MSNHNIDANNDMAESTGHNSSSFMGNTLPLDDVNETFASGQRTEYRTAPNSVHNTPSGAPRHSSQINQDDDIPDIDVTSDNSLNSLPVQMASANAYVTVYAGVEAQGNYWYRALANVAGAFPILPVHRPFDATWAVHIPGDLLTYYKFDEENLVRGPGGLGYWFKSRFIGALSWPFNQVRQYRDAAGSFYFKFELQQPLDDDDPHTHPTQNIPFFRPSDERPTTYNAPIVDPLATSGYESNTDNRTYGGSQTFNGIPRQSDNNSQQNNLGLGPTTRQQTRSNISSGVAPSSDFQARNGRDHNQASNQSGTRHPYYTPPVNGTTANTFTSAAAGSGLPAFNHQYNPQAGSGNISMGKNAITSSDGSSIFFSMESQVVERLSNLSLSALFTFTKYIWDHDALYTDPRKHYQTLKAIDGHVLRSALAGTGQTIDSLKGKPTRYIISLLKQKVIPQSAAATLHALQDTSVLDFRRSKHYDITLVQNRLDYLVDIQAYFMDCECFFRFLTEDMSPEWIQTHLPPIRDAIPKENSLINITLNKIYGGERTEGKDNSNYARSIYNEPRNRSKFRRITASNISVLQAYPEFLRLMIELLNEGIKKHHQNFEESARFDQTLRSLSSKHSTKATNSEVKTAQPPRRQQQLAHISESDDPYASYSQTQHSLSNLSDDEDHISFVTNPLNDDLFFIADRAKALYKSPDLSARDKSNQKAAFVKSAEPLKHWQDRSKEEAAQNGVSALPTICIKFIRDSCKNPKCKYSHDPDVIVKVCQAIQADYRKLRAKYLEDNAQTNKLQHLSSLDLNANEGHTSSDDSEDNDASSEVSEDSH